MWVGAKWTGWVHLPLWCEPFYPIHGAEWTFHTQKYFQIFKEIWKCLVTSTHIVVKIMPSWVYHVGMGTLREGICMWERCKVKGSVMPHLPLILYNQYKTGLRDSWWFVIKKVQCRNLLCCFLRDELWIYNWCKHLLALLRRLIDPSTTCPASENL